ncbi:alpha/beta fold hydrolase [Actinocrinis puniceicyclus]|uniref:Alpha/beta fold hydrolase n=1 Tax=Actinocrinis puniceicyclus TaxID=977794 RepID=A0A8J7WNE4_9ACTN|nr:alpha/beta fold hydrolase [Actinocrinis puniceicyclus]MBS2963029.1 alpha/beta fold hydrolase [Actinocrinis puniceicyclus]
MDEQTRWTMRRVTTAADLILDVAEQGDPGGRAVLLLHGFPQTHRCFDALAQRLAPHGLRLIAPDQRGYSPGARPADIQAYGLAHTVADALRVLDACGVERADVVGHDWGAMVAWALAAGRPDRVRTLTAVSVPHPRAMAAALADERSGQRERSAYMRLFRQPGKAEQVLLEDGAARLRALYRPLPDRAAEPHLRALSEPAALTASLNWYRAMRREDSALPPVDVPTTYVWSTEDVAIGRAAAEYCAGQVTGPFRFVELPGVSHWIPDEAPDALADEVLRRIRSTAA